MRWLVIVALLALGVFVGCQEPVHQRLFNGQTIGQNIKRIDDGLIILAEELWRTNRQLKRIQRQLHKSACKS